MKKLGDIVLWLAILVLVAGIADLVGLTRFMPIGFGVRPIGYLKFATVLVLLNIALTLREKK